MTARRIQFLAVWALSSVACDNSSELGPQLRSEVRDSAGIAIVENERPLTGSRLGWRVGDAPAVSIGVLDGDDAYQLFRVEDATRLPDGRIAVANGGTGEIRYFSADGAHLESWGGVGEGPGEFSEGDPRAVGAWPGDSIVAAAWWRGQIAVFDAEGNLGRTTTLGAGRFSYVGRMSAERMLAGPALPFGLRFGGAGSTLRRLETEFAVVMPNGEVSASVGTQAGEEWFFATGQPAGRPHPFGRSVLATVWNSMAVVAANDRYEVLAYDGDGALKRIVRRDHELRIPVQSELDDWFAGTYADRSDADQERLRSLFDGMTLVEFFPAYSALQSDPLGYLWVQEYRLPDQSENIWTVFDAEGRVQGFVELPAGLNVFEIGEHHILGLETDALAVERVQMWPLERDAG